MTEQTTDQQRPSLTLGILGAVLASSVLAAAISGAVSYKLSVDQIEAARNDNRAALRRQSLVDLRGSLIEMVNAAKDVYLINLLHYLKTGDWKNHIDLKAEQKVGYGNTKVGVYLATIDDSKLTKDVQATRKDIADLVDSTSRDEAEAAAHNMDLHTADASEGIGDLLGPLLKG
jgi:hypothetical protein